MIQSVLFFTMCLMIGEGDDRESDCSYQWFLIEDRRLFNLFFEAVREEGNDTNPNIVMGFTVPEPKLIYVRDIDNDFSVLKHEAEHAKCILNHEFNETARFICNWIIDRPQMTRGSIVPDYGYVNQVPTPKYSQNIAFATSFIPPGTTEEYYKEQQALNFKNVNER